MCQLGAWQRRLQDIFRAKTWPGAPVGWYFGWFTWLIRGWLGIEVGGSQNPNEKMNKGLLLGKWVGYAEWLITKKVQQHWFFSDETPFTSKCGDLQMDEQLRAWGLDSGQTKMQKGLLKEIYGAIWGVCCLFNLSRCLHHRFRHESFVLVGPTRRMRDIWFDQWGVEKFALVTALCLCITCNHGGTTEGADIEVESFWNRQMAEGIEG